MSEMRIIPLALAALLEEIYSEIKIGGSMKRILICEDDQEIIELTTIILKLTGHQVYVFKSCDNDIVQKVQNIKPDLVLMDLWLPEIGGEAAILQLKSDTVTRDIPIIVFSANNSALEVARRVNAEGCITKPFSITSFEDTVSQVLRRA
jgi:CheY-like chemotaxis protein